MHIYFSGIGGAGIGPLAQIAHQAGYQVSGSDQQPSTYIDYLKKHGISNVHIGQSQAEIAKLNQTKPIDWLVHSSSIRTNNPEIVFAKSQGIKISKRDELINQIIKDKKLSLIAVAGTHGKTTTTAMVIWLLKQSGLPISYSVGAKLAFGDMGHFDPQSKYFIYEADEFDRNFLAFEPFLSLITGVSWDHHEIFPTREDYQAAFREFIDQSRHTCIWQEDAQYLNLPPMSSPGISVLDSTDPALTEIKLLGQYNRLDAWLAIQSVHHLTSEPVSKLLTIINNFPGVSRRMEQIKPDLYSDYAHTPEKIRGALSVARELADQKGKRLVIVYEPLTNRRQHFIQNEYKDSFAGADIVYWLPSYLAREDPDQIVLTPEELIAKLADPSLAKPMKRNGQLKRVIEEHLKQGDLVVGLAGGGGNSLDEWLRKEFS